MAVILIAFIRSRGKPEGETGEGAFGVQKHDSNEKMRQSESVNQDGSLRQ